MQSLGKVTLFWRPPALTHFIHMPCNRILRWLGIWQNAPGHHQFRAYIDELRQTLNQILSDVITSFGRDTSQTGVWPCHPDIRI